VTPAGNRLQWLDELRGIAALTVMLGHFRILLPEPIASFPLFDIFPRGVQLFYILSGYVMYWLYARAILEPGRYAQFLTKRYFRIAPLFYLVVLLCVLAAGRPPDWTNLVSHLLILPFGFHPDYVNGIIGVEWSIYVEFWFYMLLPVLVLLYRRFGMGLLLATVAIAAVQTTIGYLFTDIPLRTHLYNQPTAQLCFFILGIVLAEHRDALGGAIWSLIAGVALLALAVLPFLSSAFTIQWAASFVLFGLLIAGWRQLPVPAVLRRGLAYLGTISYSLYLLHTPLLRAAETLGLPVGLLSFVAMTAAAILASHITERLVERPGIALGQRLVRQ
jgi:peptidoglycan/LPS O-acetylase OafA/YrhL